MWGCELDSFSSRRNLDADSCGDGSNHYFLYKTLNFLLRQATISFLRRTAIIFTNTEVEAGGGRERGRRNSIHSTQLYFAGNITSSSAFIYLLHSYSHRIWEMCLEFQAGNRQWNCNACYVTHSYVTHSKPNSFSCKLRAFQFVKKFPPLPGPSPEPLESSS